MWVSFPKVEFLQSFFPKAELLQFYIHSRNVCSIFYPKQFVDPSKVLQGFCPTNPSEVPLHFPLNSPPPVASPLRFVETSRCFQLMPPRYCPLSKVAQYFPLKHPWRYPLSEVPRCFPLEPCCLRPSLRHFSVYFWTRLNHLLCVGLGGEALKAFKGCEAADFTSLPPRSLEDCVLSDVLTSKCMAIILAKAHCWLAFYTN